MRLQVPMRKYLVLLLAVTISILIAKSGIYKYLVWKTYNSSSNSSSVSFSFKYPSAWSICDEFYPDLKAYYVHVLNKEISCETAVANKNSLSMSIIDDGWYEAVKETDIKSFLINSEEKENERIKNNELPVTGIGSRIIWKFEQYENSWYLPKNISFAKVRSLTENIETYVFLFQRRVYSIEKIPGEEFDNLLSKLILRSLKVY